MNSKRSFLKDQRGIFWVITVGVVVILVATMTWLVAMLVTNAFVSIFQTEATSPYTVQYGNTLVNEGAIVIVIIDVGMIVWMAVSAFRKERQEIPL